MYKQTNDNGYFMSVDTGLNQRIWELMSHTGQAFFSSMVEHIATRLGLRMAFIVESMDLKGDRVAPLAIWGAQEFRGKQSYDTQGTPCERLSSGAASIYLKNLPDYFPNDSWLLQSGMQSYIAIPLLNEHFHVLGHMGVLDDREIENSDEAITLLESFAHRAREEIIRKRPDTGLQRILGESDWVLYRATPPAFSPRLQMIDGAGFLGYDQSELALYDDIRCRQLFDEDRSRVLDTFSNALDNGQKYFYVAIYPFKMREKYLKNYKHASWYPFWQNLKEGYDYFELEREEPLIGHKKGKYSISQK